MAVPLTPMSRAPSSRHKRPDATRALNSPRLWPIEVPRANAEIEQLVEADQGERERGELGPVGAHDLVVVGAEEQPVDVDTETSLMRSTMVQWVDAFATACRRRRSRSLGPETVPAHRRGTAESRLTWSPR